MHKTLFFVDSIYKPLESEKLQVVLFSTDSENEQKTKIVEINQNRLILSNHRGSIREGWFVYYDEGEQFLFSYGNLSPYARKQFRTFNELQMQLKQRYIDENSDMAAVPARFLNPKGVTVTSYHINVGHGNCSIILLQAGGQYNIWMVDCSLIDKSNWNNYTNNLQICFNDITKKLQLQAGEAFHVDRFFLTHTHFDHFNGMKYLIDNGYIDGNTLCYMNLYYNWANEKYLRILEKLKTANVKFVEPVSGNSNRAISFFHPECRLYRSTATIIDAPSKYRIVNSSVNDSSTVIRFNLGGKSMVFSGDLEQNGFKSMTRAAKCSPLLNASNYYTISHHGSINGHPDMLCQNPNQPNPTPLHCITNNISKAILMGRDGAFRGIYSPIVVRYWSGIPDVLEYTEHTSHYLELDWRSGKVTKN